MNLHRIFLRRSLGIRSALALMGWACLCDPAPALEAGGRGAFTGGRGHADAPAGRATLATGTAPGGAQDGRQNLIVEAQDVAGDVGQPIPLKISVRQASDVVVESVKLLGLPPGFTVKDGSHVLRSNDESEILNLTDWNLSGLSLEHAGKRGDQIALSLVLIWKPKQSDSIEVSVTNFVVDISARRQAGTREVSPPLKGAKSPEEPARKSDPAPAPPRPAASTAMPRALGPRAGIASLPEPGPDADAARKPVGAVAPVEGGAQSPVPRPAAPTSRRPVAGGGLVERAKDLIGRGDISGARLFLERARARNEPNATFLLAQTWDPEMLRQWNVRGLRPDPDRARALYREASEQEPANDRWSSATQR